MSNTIMKRYKTYRINFQSFLRMLVEGDSFLVTKGIPKDARIVRTQEDIMTQCYYMIVESESFPLVDVVSGVKHDFNDFEFTELRPCLETAKDLVNQLQGRK